MILGLGLVSALLIADVSAGTLYRKATAPSISVDPRVELAAYDGSPWAQQYWQEFTEASDWEFVPYSGWRRSDYQGEYITVIDGIRSTWDAATTDGDVVEVWVFGGSTAWGSGQRDDHTIASHLARLFSTAELSVHVTNYGESGHQLWQEIQTLEAALISGRQPDIVVFYDGVNEPSGHSDALIDSPTHNRASTFQQRLESPASVWDVISAEYRSRSILVGAARRLRRVWTPSDQPSPNRGAVLAPVTESLENIMLIYGEGVAVSSDLAERHGFEVVHFWQPSIYTKTVVPEEAAAWTVGPYADAHVAWLQAVHSKALDQLPPGVVDISDALDATAEPVMIDHVHTNELGAQLVAERIFVEVEPLVRELVATRSGS